MDIEESYNKKSTFYDNCRENTPGWNEINKFLKNKLDDNINILDIGCGTGMFLEKLNKYNYKELHGIDPSISMINKTYEKVKNFDNCKIWKDYIENIEDNKYDLVFCCQVIQNLTLNKNEAFKKRISFYNHLHRILKSKGQLILTTRNIVDDYSNMYWYTDNNIFNKSIDDMKSFIPQNLNEEIESINKFKYIEKIETNDLIYKQNCYMDINLLNHESWFAADSFWNHVKRNNEFENFKNNINLLKENNTINKYIQQRDKLRNNISHIKILYCYKN
jgi:ubiquinone/menaquinone biosynthesis C-methylase UbiE